MKNHLFVAFALIVAAALPAHAQQMQLQIQDGLVTLDATAVPARQILDEWARVGGTKVVGAEKITGAPLTLKLVNMPERQALDIILRNVAGFMAAPRQASAAPGASAYDRIMILATSSPVPPAPANGARLNGSQPGRNSAGETAGSQRRVPPRPPFLPPSPAEDDMPQENEELEAEDQTEAQPVFTFPAPPAGANGNPVFVPVNGNAPPSAFGRPMQPGAVAAPVITLQPNANGQPTIYNLVPTPDGAPTQSPTGFSIIGAPQPGMILQPAPPTQPVKPPPGQ